MLETVETFALAIPPVGIKGLEIPSLGRGEVFEAIWCNTNGFRLRADRGSAWVKVHPEVMREHWAGEAFLQVLETKVGQQDKRWLVPLTNAPMPAAFSCHQSKVH